MIGHVTLAIVANDFLERLQVLLRILRGGERGALLFLPLRPLGSRDYRIRQQTIKLGFYDLVALADSCLQAKSV